MPITFTFEDFKDKKPKHNQEIVYLDRVSSFDTVGYNPRVDTVEYSWFEITEDNALTGNQALFDPATEFLIPLNSTTQEDDGSLWLLRAIIAGNILTDGIYWMDSTEYLDNLFQVVKTTPETLSAGTYSNVYRS